MSAGYERRSDEELEDLGVLSTLSTSSYESSLFYWFLFCCAGLEEDLLVVIEGFLAGAFAAALLLFNNWL